MTYRSALERCILGDVFDLDLDSTSKDNIGR